MSTATLDARRLASEDDSLQYRALHTGALIGLMLGILSFSVLIIAANSLTACLATALIPAIGMFVSARSLARIRRQPDQFTGETLARIGLWLSVFFLVSGVGYGGYVYATEVPDGYTRISFTALKPDELDERAGMAVPPAIADLEGKKVFIKGYIRPDSITVDRGIKQFLLVRDNNQCCFGDLSKIKYYDQIDVDLTGPLRVDYSQGIFRIGGTLHIEPKNAAFGSSGPVFSLKGDYAKD
jgi:hypothetical protein